MKVMVGTPRVSVLMPTYGQAAFVRRAIASVRAQTLPDWELIIIDDASPDDTHHVITPDLADPRIQYHRRQQNGGLGVALNDALAHARAALIAYLPSDDLYYRDHLASLVACLDEQPTAVLACSGVRHHYNRDAPGQIPGFPLQLVQVLHRRTDDRWLERRDLVTDDLDRMYWRHFRQQGDVVGTGIVTCEWVDHPLQRHKVIQEPLGGINPYRARYHVREPLRFHTTVGNRIDEVALYQHYRNRPDTPMASDGLKILLVGELAYNADRILALEEQGHRLYGLWTPDPHWYNGVGPLPFGHVEDIPREGWQEAVRRIQPDVIYALLNWQAVPFVHHVLMENSGIPFVWHFKEGPFICIEQGIWPQLFDLSTRADGQIYGNEETRDWWETVVPGATQRHPTLLLDGDLPKRDCFLTERSPRLSAVDGEFHTVVPGRPIGLRPRHVAELASLGIHLHFYGDFTHGQWKTWIERALAVGEGHLHLHSQVDQDRWVEEFSQYDAGWLHFVSSDNQGDPGRASWDDLNYPARMATLAVSGLPLLQYDNTGSRFATQSVARRFDIGIFFTEMVQLRAQLDDTRHLERLRSNVWQRRAWFMFDHHADDLIAFFRQVIAGT